MDLLSKEAVHCTHPGLSSLEGTLGLDFLTIIFVFRVQTFYVEIYGPFNRQKTTLI